MLVVERRVTFIFVGTFGGTFQSSSAKSEDSCGFAALIRFPIEESNRLFGSIPACLQSLNERHQRAVDLFIDALKTIFQPFKGRPALPLRFARLDQRV